MSELPDLIPLADADITLWAIRRGAGWLCRDANNLCNAIDRLADLPDFDTEAEHELNNAITALSFALSAATEKRAKLLTKRIADKIVFDLKTLVEVE